MRGVLPQWLCSAILAAPAIAVVSVLLQIPLHSETPSSRKHEVLKDGVEHWYLSTPGTNKSYLERRLEELCNVVFPQTAQPFGRSIAFLAGVGKYHNMSPQLPSVRNDLEQMRNFLLNDAGFDEVYVAEDDVVNRDLVEQYVKGVIPGMMNENDRLLFYYSGHGGDHHDKAGHVVGKTGYMLFGGAREGQFWGQQVLPIDALLDWSRELQNRHILFLIDSCASGLAFTSKSGPDDTKRLLIQTLSGNGSRTVLTAGTADESTYAVEGREQAGNGIFTKSLLNAYQSHINAGEAFIPVRELFSGIETQVAQFSARERKKTTPRMWSLQEDDYRGTFVFLNTRAGTLHLSTEQAKALGVPVAKGAEEASSVADDPVVKLMGLGWQTHDDGNILKLEVKGIPPDGSLSALRRIQRTMSVQLDAIDATISQWSVLENLTTLDLSGSSVRNLGPLSTLKNLRELRLAMTQTDDIGPLKELQNLTVLDLSNTKVGNAEALRELRNLEDLKLGYSPIEDLGPLKELENLSKLDLGGTRVNNVSPLRNLVKLTELQLGFTSVSDVEPLNELINLKELDLHGTPLSNVQPLRGLKNLQTLDLGRTKVSAADIEALEQGHPGLVISH